MSEVQTYDPGAGEHISRTAKITRQLALDMGNPVEFTFNGVLVHVKPGDTEASIIQQFTDEMEASSERYRNSPQGQKAAREAEERRLAIQAEYDSLVVELDRLNMASQSDVLRWLRRLTACDHSGVSKQTEDVLLHFAAGGLFASRDSRECHDQDSEYLWIVEQCLNGIQRFGVPHGMADTVIDRWFNKYIDAS